MTTLFKLTIFLSHYFVELQNAEKRLAETRDKLDRIQTGQHNVRGKEKRVEVLQKSIADLELQVSARTERSIIHLRANHTECTGCYVN